MIALYKKINTQQSASHFLMPIGLSYVKILSEHGIDWHVLHIIDAFSLVCAIRIEDGRLYLRKEAERKMQAAGIKSIKRAAASDFNAL